MNIKQGETPSKVNNCLNENVDVLKVENLIYEFDAVVDVTKAKEFAEKYSRLINDVTHKLEIEYNEFEELLKLGVEFSNGYVQIFKEAYIDCAVKRVKPKEKDYTPYLTYATEVTPEYMYFTMPFDVYQEMSTNKLHPMLTNEKLLKLYLSCNYGDIHYVMTDEDYDIAGDGSFREFEFGEIH